MSIKLRVGKMGSSDEEDKRWYEGRRARRDDGSLPDPAHGVCGLAEVTQDVQGNDYHLYHQKMKS